MARWKATCANSNAERSGVGKVKCRPALGSTAQKTFAVPQRSYSLSRLASRPGAAGEAGRTSACKVTGFSPQKGTPGREGSRYAGRIGKLLTVPAVRAHPDLAGSLDDFLGAVYADPSLLLTKLVFQESS